MVGQPGTSYEASWKWRYRLVLDAEEKGELWRGMPVVTRNELCRCLLSGNAAADGMWWWAGV